MQNELCKQNSRIGRKNIKFLIENIGICKTYTQLHSPLPKILKCVENRSLKVIIRFKLPCLLSPYFSKKKRQYF